MSGYDVSIKSGDSKKADVRRVFIDR